MRRKQLYLPDDLDNQLALVAARRGTSQALIVREALGRYLGAEADRDQDSDPILNWIHGVEGNPRPGGKRLDASVEHDRYLYGGDEDPGEAEPEP